METKIPLEEEKNNNTFKEDIINRTKDYVRIRLHGEGSGHDWWHVYRVWKIAKQLGHLEGADLFIVELAALLHDIADWKFHDGDETIGPRIAAEWLHSLSVEQDAIDHICQIIKDMTFKGAGVVPITMKSKEGMVVQDADRLDAIGAMGIARCFAYGGHKGQLMYDPSCKITMHSNPQEYNTAKTTSINHFYEKLLLLKDRMNTKSGKTIAQKRHDLMLLFLDNFFDEWEGNICQTSTS